MTIPDDLASLLGRLGRRAEFAEAVTKRSGLKERLALRLVLDDGSLLKARRLATTEHAESWSRLRRLIGDRTYLASLLHQEGALVLEEWIEGDTLPMMSLPTEQLAAAGKVLAQLHLLQVPDGGAAPCTTQILWMKELLASLVAHSALSGIQAGQLENKMVQTLPNETLRGVIHYDFCGENLVLNAARGVVSIDHEWLCVGSLEFDLARAITRWNLADESRASFLDAYNRAGGPASRERLDWWLLCNKVFAAEVRARRGWPDAQVSVENLLLSL